VTGVRIDGDAARAARREAKGGDIVVTLGGRDIRFPVEMPLDVPEAAAKLLEDKPDASMHEYRSVVVRALLVDDEQWAQLRAARPSADDLAFVYDEVLAAYAVSTGESSPSADSSEPAGGSSKPSSPRSTTSTRARSSSRAKAARAGC
jgi:hypothetical protein